jgi:NTE family protein
VNLCRGPAVPALPASAAIPGVYPSVTIGDQILMDGGVADHTTLDYAVRSGADEVYLLTPGFSCALPAPPSTVMGMMLHGYNLLSEHRMSTSIRQNRHSVRLQRLPPLCPVEVLPFDFGYTAELIDRATESTRHWLEGRESVSSQPETMDEVHPSHAVR